MRIVVAHLEWATTYASETDLPASAPRGGAEGMTTLLPDSDPQVTRPLEIEAEPDVLPDVPSTTDNGGRPDELNAKKSRGGRHEDRDRTAYEEWQRGTIGKMIVRKIKDMGFRDPFENTKALRMAIGRYADRHGLEPPRKRAGGRPKATGNS